MPKTQKYSLDELKVQSFITSLTPSDIKGGWPGSTGPNCSVLVCPTDLTCPTVEGPCPTNAGCGGTLPYTVQTQCSTDVQTCDNTPIPSMDHC